MSDDRQAAGPIAGGSCNDCGTLSYPPADRCMNCLGTSIASRTLSDRGLLYAYSTVHVGPNQFPRPYIVGYADLPEGLRLFGRLEAPMPLGTTVAIASGEIGRNTDGDAITGIRFSPIEEVAA